MNTTRGTLYLVPVLLGEGSVNTVIPDTTLEIARNLKNFIAENAKTARQFMKQIEMTRPFGEINVMELDKHADHIDFRIYFKALRNGDDTGLMSEAGMPGIADPGSQFILQAHKESIKVVPLPGPSSIFLALAASGLNGQGFAFHGYLPKDKQFRVEKLKQLENNARRLNQTQIFIETPYRNQALFTDLISSLSGSTMLCIASDITLRDEKIRTMTITDWKKEKVDLNKRPTVFLLL